MPHDQILGQILFFSVKKNDDTFASVSFTSLMGAASTSAAAAAANGFAKGPVASTAIDMFAWDQDSHQKEACH